uniref:Putative HNH endonuclease n=1 Tax=viral metagenome TaxID=1070528 RepID=A0A6H1ZNI4_9ZZZZ
MEFEVEGKSCLVDDCDWEWLKDIKFTVRKVHHQYYLYYKSVPLHKIVFIAHHGSINFGNAVDHVNRKSLDNRSINLRQLLNRDNLLLNRRKYKGDGTSKFIGVSRDKRNNKWRAQYTVGVNNVYLGLYNTEKLAAIAHDIYAVKTFKDPLRLNFPEEVVGIKNLIK